MVEEIETPKNKGNRLSASSILSIGNRISASSIFDTSEREDEQEVLYFLDEEGYLMDE